MPTLIASPIPGVSDALFAALCGRQERIEFGYREKEDGHEMTDEQLVTLNRALKHCSKKDKSYRPYCMACPTMPRVALVADGFRCPACDNHFGFDLVAAGETR